ncbi:MAG: hypothetical protein LBH86_01305 [Oscillospiraceae bacterium]|nr:hypothetical protein [Oscillospiraceae bacterium]
MDKAFPLTPDALGALFRAARAPSGGAATPETPAPEPKPAEPADSEARTPATVLLALLDACREAGGASGDSEALLLALRPYLRPERRAQVERVAELVRLARAVYGGYQTTSGGEEHA